MKRETKFLILVLLLCPGIASAISGTGRLTEQQLETETKNLPDPTVPSDVREKMFDRFQRNIDQAASGIPKIPGIELPSDIRARIEGEMNKKARIETEIDMRQKTAAEGKGQFSDPQREHPQGSSFLFKPTNKFMRVTKVYPDKSFDAEETSSP